MTITSFCTVSVSKEGIDRKLKLTFASRMVAGQVSRNLNMKGFKTEISPECTLYRTAEAAIIDTEFWFNPSGE